MPRTTLIYYREGGSVPLLEWLGTLPAKVQDKCLAYLQRLEESGHELRRPTADYLRAGIYELRSSYQGVHYRMLYFFPGRARPKPGQSPHVVVLSHGIVKQDAVPDAEINRAVARKSAFEANPAKHSFDPAKEK